MHAHRLRVTIAQNQQLRVDLPTDFPSGPAEVIILSENTQPKKVVALGGILATAGLSVKGDPIAEALDELRIERAETLEQRSKRHAQADDKT